MRIWTQGIPVFITGTGFAVLALTIYEYSEVANRSTSRLVAPPRIFRLLMKGKFMLTVKSRVLTCLV